MLLKIDTLTCIKCNEVSLASRQWRRLTVKSDGRPHTTGGELRIDEVRQLLGIRPGHIPNTCLSINHVGQKM